MISHWMNAKANDVPDEKKSGGEPVDPAVWQPYVNGRTSQGTHTVGSDTRVADAVPPLTVDVPGDRSVARSSTTKLVTTDDIFKPDATLVLNGLNHYSTIAGFKIPFDAKPGEYHPKPGETLADIARKHLGPDASLLDVARHEFEIAQLNGIGNGDSPHHKQGPYQDYRAENGDVLRLPGHTKDGSIIAQDSRGTKYTGDTNGVLRVDYPDKTGYTRGVDPEGNIVKSYFGPNPSDKYMVKQSPDGKVLYNDRTRPQSELAKDLATERDRLITLASGKIGLTHEQDQFFHDMRVFQERMLQPGATGEDKAAREKEVAQTYKEVSRILEATGQQPLTDRERVRAALGVMQSAALPNDTVQGRHLTCQTATLEGDIYESDPARAAAVVADVATKGKYTAYDGTVVRMDPSSLRAHDDAALNVEPGLGVRTYAGQLFQLAAINSIYTRANENKFPPGDQRFQQVKPQDNFDTGERLTDYSKTPPVSLARAEWLNWTHNKMDNVIQMNYLLTGRWQPERYLSNGAYGGGSESPEFNNVDELKQHLLSLKQSGELPAFLSVRLNNPLVAGLPLRPQDGPLTPMAVAGDGHLIRVLDFNSSTGEATFANPLGNDLSGSKIDRTRQTTSIDELYKATNAVPLAEWIDGLEKTRGKVSEAKFAHNLETIAHTVIDEWKEMKTKGHPVDETERQNGLARFYELVNKLPRERREALLSSVQKQLVEKE